MTQMQNEVSSLKFQTGDGWTLAGDIHVGPKPRKAIIISAGTGYPKGFYRHAAGWFADQGAVVLTYDYRGIGDSAPKTLVGSEIDYPDWGLDLSAATDAIEQRFPDLPIAHIAHSAGGKFIGLMPNHAKIQRHAFLSVGTGYFGGHHRRNLPLEMYFWWGMGPYSLARHGYIKPIGGWRGQALPPKLFRTWRRWSHRRSYFQPELKTTLTSKFYNDVASPIRSWVFSDDPIATSKSAQDVVDCYPNAASELITVSPPELGLKHVGHDGAFRKGRTAIWEQVWQFLNS